MTNLASAFQPVIDALEKDLADLERQANCLLQTINLLREKAGLPPRPPSGWQPSFYGVQSLRHCVEVDRQRRGGVPVLKGTRVTVSETLAEIAESCGVKEVADNFDLDADQIKDFLNGLSLLLNTDEWSLFKSGLVPFGSKGASTGCLKLLLDIEETVQ